MEDDNQIELHWWLDTDLQTDDTGVETLVVNDFTEDDIKSTVEDYLSSRDFIYHDVGVGYFTGCVYFTVMVGLVPMSDQMETLFAGTYSDHIVDWE